MISDTDSGQTGVRVRLSLKTDSPVIEEESAPGSANELSRRIDRFVRSLKKSIHAFPSPSKSPQSRRRSRVVRLRGPCSIEEIVRAVQSGKSR